MTDDRLRGSWIAVAALLAAALALPGTALAKRTSGELSPRLAKLAEPSVRSAPQRVQAKRLSLAKKGPGSLLRRGNRVLAYVRFDSRAPAALSRLRRAGVQVVHASGRYQTVTVAVKPGQLHRLAGLAGVEAVTPAFTPITAAPTCPSGGIVSEGDQQLNADLARVGPPSVDGSGVTVGILSDSFDQATEAADGSGEIATKAEEDVESGDLPGECPETTEVGIRSTLSEALEDEAGDEGRAMAQIVHDLAPGAPIEFASAFNGEAAFAQSIEDMAEPVVEGGAGAEVIADDVFYLEEPFFQDGPVAVAVDEAVAGGATYFSAAGNDNLFDGEGNEIASWETPEFRDSGSCPPLIAAKPGFNAGHCLDFHPGAAVDRSFGIEVDAHATLTVDLQWGEPRFGVSTDLDAFLLDAEGHPVAEAFEDNVGDSEMPVEVLQWENETGGPKVVQLVVNQFSGEASPRIKFGLIQNGGGVSATEYPRSTGEDIVGPTVFGHAAAAGAIAVGAIRFDKLTVPEPYSSRGPTYRDLGPVVSETPAEPIAPETVSKPDLVATDCGRTTFFAFFGKIAGIEGWHFCGTSAAAPHAAAVAALMLEAKPGADPAAVREAFYASAAAVGTSGPCAVGAGLVEAVGAVEAIVDETPAAGPTCELPPAGDPEEAAAPGSWGSETPPPPPPAPPVSSSAPPVVALPPSQPKARPKTFFRHKPRRVIRTRHRRAKVVFRFGSNVIGVSYACRVDGGLFRRCRKRFARRYPAGRHVVRVSARDAEGNGDPTPATYRFRVKRRR